MAITVTTNNEQVTASVTDERVSATVSPASAVAATVTAGFGGVGPQGPAGSQGPAGETGPQGPQGVPGDSGVVAASAPLTYDAQTQAVGLSIGTGLEVVDDDLTLAAHSHDASEITSGTLPRGRLPIANETQLGGVIAGQGITIFSAGVIVPTYGSSAGTSCQGNDARLSNSREWTAATISQEEAEAGTATTRRAFTAQRVKQAAVAAAPVQSVAGRTGAIVLAVGDISNAVSTSDARLSDARTPLSHTHEIADVTNLQTTLDGKQPSGSYAAATHTHAVGDLTQSGATTNQVIAWNGSAWAPATVSGGGGSTSASDLTSGTLNDQRLSSKAQSAINIYLWGNFR